VILLTMTFCRKTYPESKLIDASSSQGVGDSMGDFREIDQVVNEDFDSNMNIEELNQLGNLIVECENDEEENRTLDMNLDIDDLDLFENSIGEDLFDLDAVTTLNHAKTKIFVDIVDPKRIIRDLKRGSIVALKTTESSLKKKMLKDINSNIVKPGKRRRCLGCEICRRPDCKTCKYCLDMVKYGGKGSLRQKCSDRKCFL